MIRNLKILGLAMGALLAFGAVAASSASAQEHPHDQGLLTSDGPVTLTGEDTGEEQNWFKAFGNEVECPESTYTGHAVKDHAETTKTEEETGEKHELLPSGATEVTVTPHYRQTDDAETANCDVNTPTGTLSATVTMNGCDYEFYDFTTVAENTYSFLADIVCPNGPIIVKVYSGHGHGFEVCRLTIPAQAGLEGFQAKHTTGEADDIDLTGLTDDIFVTEEGLCGHAETTEAEYNLDVTVTGHNEVGNPTPVTITDATS